MTNEFRSPEGDLERYFITEYWLVDQWIGDTLWVWGDNINGSALSINTTGNRSTPITTFAGGTNWKQVHNTSHTAAIKTDGTLWVWGYNGNGQLGVNFTTGTSPERSTPITTFAGGTNWKQVSTGYLNTAAVKTDGTLWTWGDNQSAQLGTNNVILRSTPVTTFAGGNNWKQVSCGNNHTAAIKTDGSLWIWGENFRGQLGINTNVSRSTPVTTFAGGNNWKQVACGDEFTAAIKIDGTLWTWGFNQYGELGINENFASGLFIDSRSTPVTTFAGGTNWKSVTCVAYRFAGGSSTAAIKTDGSLWIWGSNASGKLGINTTTPGNISTPITTFAGGTNWKQVSCSRFNTLAIKTDGTLWIWGANGLGRLGINDSNAASRLTPVTTFLGGTNWKQATTGNNHVVAVKSGTDPNYPD